MYYCSSKFFQMVFEMHKKCLGGKLHKLIHFFPSGNCIIWSHKQTTLTGFLVVGFYLLPLHKFQYFTTKLFFATNYLYKIFAKISAYSPLQKFNSQNIRVERRLIRSPDFFCKSHVDGTTFV